MKRHAHHHRHHRSSSLHPRCNGFQAVYRISFVDFFFFLALALGSKLSVVRFFVLRCDSSLWGGGGGGAPPPPPPPPPDPTRPSIGLTHPLTSWHGQGVHTHAWGLKYLVFAGFLVGMFFVDNSACVCGT